MGSTAADQTRHGLRLDQADSSWRATADFPWDSPLTYGGWIQCQTLGARIDKELQLIANQISPDDLSWEEDGESVERPKKKRRIIIHTSPYKRCIQTSIAIAAGLKYPQPEHVRPVVNPYQTANTATNKPQSVPATSNGSGVHSMPANTSEGNIAKDKIALKVDPWLSEWLSTGYFEEDGPPPASEKIVERAKETLTRPIEEIRGADLSAFLPVPETPDPDDADKENELKQNLQEKGGLRAMAAAGHALPHRNRTISFNFEKGSLRTQLGQKLRQRARTSVVYSPPVPQYALAPQDSIPAGYVAHARDACVSPDLNWDSIAMGWGDAGTYPEEWSAMHVRFRVGLQKMLVYYQDDYQAHGGEEDENNIGEDVILVLVTHQAGANALIRLVTGAPALHDVGVASLTLAVRRPVLCRLPSLAGTSHSPLGYDRESRRNSRRGSLDLGLADDFEMRIIASTDHLRYGSNPLGLNSPRFRPSPAVAARKGTGSDNLDGFSIGDPLAWRSNTSSNPSRTVSSRGRTGDFTKPAINTGLWGSPSITPLSKETIEEDTPMSPKSRPTTPGSENDGILPESKLSSPGRSRANTVANAGLWGVGNANLAVRAGSGESTMWKGSSSGGSGTVSRARSPAKRRWASLSTDSM